MAQLKKPTTYQEQLDILQRRNIVIDDPDRCAAVLESINYYRFTAYFLPFKLKDGTYQSGTRFQRVYRIYEFDRKLRGVLFSALEEVEVYLRVKFAYFHAHKYGQRAIWTQQIILPTIRQRSSMKISPVKSPVINAPLL